MVLCGEWGVEQSTWYWVISTLFLPYFSDKTRTRAGSVDSPLEEILIVTLVVVICGSESYDNFED